MLPLARRLLLFAAASLLLAFAAPAQAAPRWHKWRGAPTGVFRTGAYSRGQREWIYTNGIHQAQGANTDGKHRTDYFTKPGPIDPGFMQRDVYLAETYDLFGTHRSTHNGDYQLPQDAKRYPEGTADLAEVRLAVEGRYLYVRFAWNSMPRRDAQIATLTFAPQGATPSAVAWPHNARLSSRWSSALTVWGTGGALARRKRRERRVSVRTGNHVTEARIPLNLLPRASWTLGGGAGLSDPKARSRYWTVPAGNATATAPGSRGSTSPTNVWDLLFARDRPWTFDELRQGDDLASGSVGGDTAAVEPRILQGAVVRVAQPPAVTGDLSRVFESRLFQGDGIHKEAGAAGTPSGGSASEGANQTFLYTGRRQYYGMHVPARYPASHGRWPLIVYLHGFTGLPDEAFHNPVGLIDTADKRGYIVATPLGRGDYFYKGQGDLDVLEVIRDVSKRYRIDADRIYLMGHSMGGYGTNNVAMHHPDLFAAVAPAEGTDSIPLHANLRNLPWFEMSAEEDLDTGAKDARSLYGKLSADGYDATLLVYKTKIHEYSSIYDTLPRLFGFFGAHRRVRDPGIVTWTRPGGDMPRVGVRYDGAYWLRGVRSAAGATAQVTVTSRAISHRLDSPGASARTDRTVDEGGPTGRTLAELTQTVPARTPFVSLANALEVSATGALALSADLRRARLVVARGKALNVTVVADRSLRLALNHVAGRRVSVSVDGHPAQIVRLRRGTASLLVSSGHHTLRVAPHR